MRPVYHPNSWLSGFRNVKPGLERRTQVLNLLERDKETAKGLSNKLDVTYSTILYHLHNMEARGRVERATSKPPYQWKLIPVGQQSLNDYGLR